MDHFYVSNIHLDRCNNPEKYIKTKPNIYNIYGDLDDIPVITIFSKIAINNAYVANYIIKSIVKQNDISFFKPSLYFFKFELSNNNYEAIQEIVEISKRKSLITKKHIICIELKDKFNKDIKTRLISILKNHIANSLYIIQSTYHIPVEILNISCNISCNNEDPINLYFNTENKQLTSQFIKHNIDTLCNKLEQQASISSYTNQLRQLTINITASGIPHYLLSSYIIDYIENEDDETKRYVINVLADMEYKLRIVSKSIFVIEYYFDLIVKKLISNLKKKRSKDLQP